MRIKNNDIPVIVLSVISLELCPNTDIGINGTHEINTNENIKIFKFLINPEKFFVFKYIKDCKIMKSHVILQGREYGKNGKQYTQYRITISPDIIEFLGWNKNDKIELVTSGNSKDWKIICNNKSQKTTHNS